MRREPSKETVIVQLNRDVFPPGLKSMCRWENNRQQGCHNSKA